MSLNIVFCGSPDFPCHTLKQLIDKRDYTISVISQTDKIRSRGKKSTPTAVKSLALKNSLPTYTPESKIEFENIIKKINPDIIIVIAYGMILPKSIVSNYYCINAHGSLLPQYRGASPIQASILNQDKNTGITIIKMNEKMDEGNILLQESIDISPKDNFQIVHDKLAKLSTHLIITFLNKFKNKTTIVEIEQDHNKASYCHKINKGNLLLNKSDTLERTLAKIKAFSPLPGAYVIIDNKRVKILDAEIIENKLYPLKVKPEGKKIMSYSDYLLGQQKEIILC